MSILISKPQRYRFFSSREVLGFEETNHEICMVAEVSKQCPICMQNPRLKIITV